MQYLNLTLPEPEANLALDEALLEEAERSPKPYETLRFWEPDQPMVVIGTSSRVDDEVDRQQTDRLNIPVFRRVSGGLAIVTGPGCLMYSVILSYELRPQLRSLDQAHCWVLGRIVEALKPSLPGVRVRGTSDLVNENDKFSGNSVRCKRNHLLYHGTLLYDFPLELISTCLKHPHRQPEYRSDRPHDQFVTNLNLQPDLLRDSIRQAFQADIVREVWPEEATEKLLQERYRQSTWNFNR